MTPSIVVLTDFFAVTNRALSYAAGLAVPLKASLLLLHVRHDELLSPAEFTGRHTTEGSMKTLYAMEKLASEQPVTTAVDISNSTLAEAVQEVVALRPPLLVALGRAGAESTPHELVSDTAMNLLRDTPYPLLVIPPAGWDAFPPRRLLLAVDGEPFSLVEYHNVLGHLLHATQGNLSFVHVIADEKTAPSADAVLDTVRANDLLSELAEGGSLRQVQHNSIAAGILQEAAGQQADMLVIIARRHSLLGGLFHRSVTAKLLRESAIPVLVLPAAD